MELEKASFKQDEISGVELFFMVGEFNHHKKIANARMICRATIAQ